jgi:hypothetical protein
MYYAYFFLLVIVYIYLHRVPSQSDIGQSRNGQSGRGHKEEEASRKKETFLWPKIMVEKLYVEFCLIGDWGSAKKRRRKCNEFGNNLDKREKLVNKRIFLFVHLFYVHLKKREIHEKVP